MKVNTRRIGVVYVIILLIAVLVVVRIIDLQFIHKPEDRSVIKKTRSESVLPCTRGSILSDDGRYLAFSIPEYRMGMDCVQATDTVFNSGIDSLAICLSEFYKDKKPSEYKKMIVERRAEGRNKGSRYLVLNRRLLTYQEMKEVASFPILREGRSRGGRSEEKVDHRTYPYGRLGFRTLGYIKSQDETPTIGIEGGLDSVLRGTNGSRPLRLTEGNQWIDDFDREVTEPVDGIDVQTTIDIDMQDIAQKALKNTLSKNGDLHAGTVIVMEVATGEIKAMVNLEKYNGDFDETYNYAIGRKGEPGSVFKATSLSILLEDKKLTLDTEMPAIVNWSFRGKPLPADTYLRNYSRISIRQGFAISSNNVFRIQVANNYGDNPQEYIDKLHALRILDSIPLEIKGLANAGVRGPASRLWSPTDLPQIGMGYVVEVTPLHTLNFYNALANGGVMMQPHLVKNYQKNGVIVKDFPPVEIGRVVSEETAAIVREAMRGVITNERGTGHRVFKGCNVEVAGKTGTARVAQGTRGYSTSGGKFMHQATFVGFFPYDNPKYSMITVVYSELTSHFFYGATWGGPVFREIAENIYAYAVDWQDPVQAKSKLPENRDVKDVDRKQACAAGLVPDVRGLGLRDAVCLLEKAGYAVNFEGKGKVASQVPAAGEPKSTNITLTLKEETVRNDTEANSEVN